MPEVGLEPTPPLGDRILSPANDAEKSAENEHSCGQDGSRHARLTPFTAPGNGRLATPGATLKVETMKTEPMNLHDKPPADDEPEEDCEW